MTQFFAIIKLSRCDILLHDGVQYIHRICVDATEHRLCICLSKVHYFRRGSTFITIRFCIACNFFFIILFLTTCWGLFALALEVFLNHCYFYFHERKVLLPSRKILVMHSPCLQIFYVCVHVFVSFFVTCLETCQTESYQSQHKSFTRGVFKKNSGKVYSCNCKLTRL